MSSTATQIIDSGLKSINLIEYDDTVGSSGSTQAQSYGSEALRQLNNILALCSSDGLMIPYRTRATITTSGADYKTTLSVRPLHIEALTFTAASNTDIKLIRMDVSYFESIVDKSVVSWPTRFLYDQAYADGIIYFDCTLADGSSLTMTYLAPLSSISALTDTVTIPDEYVPYLESNVAIYMCLPGMVVPPGVARKASRSEDAIRTRARMNRGNEMTPDFGVPSVSGRHNIEIDS